MKVLLPALLALALCAPKAAAGGWQQTPQSPQEREKQLQEYIDSEIERLENLLKLESWQVFYVDSILNHDHRALQAELQGLSEAKVNNYDLYARSKDNWDEKIYQAFGKVFTQDQWKKYLKNGAAREKKARDKRLGKFLKESQEKGFK